MKFLFYLAALIVWALSFIWDILPLGYSETSPLWTRVTYMFAHVGFLHMLLNLLSIDLMVYNLRRFILPDLLLPVAILGAALATVGTEKVLPTIGASGIGYFLFGVFGVMRVSTKTIIVLALIVLVNVLVSHYNVNTGVHIVSLVYGVVFGLVLRIKTGERIRNRKTHIA